MTAPRDHDGPAARLDRELSGLLSDAVSDVEPTDALDTIRTRTKVTPMSSRRPWLLAAGGAVVATAAVITAIALAGGNLPGTTADDDGPDPADRTSRVSDPTPSESDEPSPGEPTSSAPSGGSGSDPVPVYLVSETPQGLRLFREFQPGTGEDPLLASAVATVEGRSLDPDYRSLWPEGTSVASVVSDGADILTVDLTGAPHDLPPGMSQADAGLAVQQVIYSVQAAHGQGRVGVQLLLDGGRTDQVLGQPASEPLANGPVLETLSMMNITYPGEGATVSGSFTANGVNNGFEASVGWQLLDGSEVVGEGFGTAEGWGEEKLFPWEVEVDVSGLEPGAYTFVASNDDPSGGTEGAGPHTDTRVIIVE